MEDHSVPPQGDDLPFRFRRKEVPEGDTRRSWEQVAAGIDRKEAAMAARQARHRAAGMLAAFAVVVVAAWMMWWAGGERMIEVRTAYGEIRRVVLPDSSVVYLNANSVLRRRARWEEGRDVWLQGEAYFEIQPQAGNDNPPFLVHASRVKVEVLGTKFNVNILPDKTTVSLKEGKVQLVAKEVVQDDRQVLVMKPGDEVQVNRQQSFFLKEGTNVDQIADWRNHRYHFDNTSLADITEIIRSRFGYEVIIKDTTLYSRNLSGDLYAGDIDQFTKALSITMKLTIEKRDHQLIIKPGK